MAYLIHDVRYLIAGLRVLLMQDGILEAKSFRRLTMEEINRYLLAKADKYGLRRPRTVRSKIAKDVVNELVSLGLVRAEAADFVFTPTGRHAAQLLAKRDFNRLRFFMCRLMLDRYPEMIFLLHNLSRSGPEAFLAIPEVDASFVLKHGEDASDLARQLLSVAMAEVPTLRIDKEVLTSEIREEIQRGGAVHERAQAAFERILIMSALGGLISSRRKYDVVRERTTFFELTNYGRFRSDGMSVERLYATSWMEGGTPLPNLPGDFRPLRVNGLTLHVHEVEDTPYNRGIFLRVLAEAYERSPKEFGYARVADVRDLVCFALRIPDRVFEELFASSYRENPRRVVLDFSFEAFSSKRLPIVLPGSDSRFNLMKMTV